MIDKAEDPMGGSEDQLSEPDAKETPETDYKLRLTLLEQRVTKAEEEIKALHAGMATEIVDVAIAKLSPSAADFIIFWLPERFTQDDAFKAGQGLGPIIGNRFRFSVFVKGGVEVQLIEGSKDILLPS